MKRNLLILATLVALASCHSAKQTAGGSGADRKASQWFSGRQWLGGLQLTPNASINQEEFYRQYQLNPKWWDEAFRFLRTTDLQSLKPGSYVIDSNNVIATVTALLPKQRDEVNWEGHHNFNDLQYVITGKAGMGMAPVGDPKVTVKTPYESRSDTEVFSVDGGNYHDADAGSFFIFTPKDVHRPAFRSPSGDNIKKIVIKVRVPQAG